jgi:hypothetical protein
MRGLSRTVWLPECGLDCQSGYNALLEWHPYAHGNGYYIVGTKFDLDDQLDDRELRRTAPLLF